MVDELGAELRGLVELINPLQQIPDHQRVHRIPQRCCEGTVGQALLDLVLQLAQFGEAACSEERTKLRGGRQGVSEGGRACGRLGSVAVGHVGRRRAGRGAGRRRGRSPASGAWCAEVAGAARTANDVPAATGGGGASARVRALGGAWGAWLSATWGGGVWGEG